MSWTALTTLASAFLSGLLLGLPANAAAPLRAHLDLSESAAQRLRTLFLLALVPLMLVVGQVIDKWGSADVLHDALILGLLLAATGLALFGVRRNPRTALTGTLLLAAATACLLPAATLLMPLVLDGTTAVNRLNFGYVFIGAGMFLAAPFLERVPAGVSFRRTMLSLALVTVGAATAAIIAPRAQLAAPRPFDSAQFFTEVRLLFAALTVLLYFPLEASLGRWSAHCLTDLGYSPRRVAWLLLLLALVFLAARVATAIFLPRYGDVLLLTLILVVAIIFGNLSGAGPSAGAKGLLVMWACCGPVFPTLLALVLEKAPGAATTFAALFGVGVLGYAVLAPIMSRVSDSHVLRGQFGAPMLFGTLLVATTIVVFLLY
jgi:hypothetical protein